MADNSEAKELRAKLKEATADVAAASKKKHDLIENDPKTASAKVGFQRTRDALKKAKADLDEAEGNFGRIQSQLQTLRNQQANLQSQQQMMQKNAGQQGISERQTLTRHPSNTPREILEILVAFTNNT